METIMIILRIVSALMLLIAIIGFLGFVFIEIGEFLECDLGISTRIMNKNVIIETKSGFQLKTQLYCFFIKTSRFYSISNNYNYYDNLEDAKTAFNQYYKNKQKEKMIIHKI